MYDDMVYILEQFYANRVRVYDEYSPSLRSERFGLLVLTLEYMKKSMNNPQPQVLRLERTEAEKERRHIHGDKGAKFHKGAKMFAPAYDGLSTTITTTPNMIIEYDSIDSINERADDM